MASGIILSAGVRQNLLSLQATADLMSLTQNRLATGKKVNSALDNPSNFFTSQSLSDRASDLNSLLDSIGQAQSTLNAANQGLTSLTKLVQSAKSIAQQARQTTQAAASYDAVDVSSSVAGTEALGTVQGADLSPRDIKLAFTAGSETAGTTSGTASVAAGIAHDGALTITLNIRGVDVDFTDTSDHTVQTDQATTLTFVQGLSDGGGHTLSDYVTVAADGAHHLTFTAQTTDVDLTVKATSDANVLTDLGLTANQKATSTSLLDNIVAGGGSVGSTLDLSVNGGAANTITFDHAHVETLADLNTWISNNGGQVTGGAVAGAGGFTLNLAKGSGVTLGLTASDAGVKSALGLNVASAAVASNGTNRGGLGTAVNQLTRTYNSDVTLAEIDPTNLTNGGNLTINIDKNDGNGFASQVIGLSGSDALSSVVTKLQANATIAANIDVSTVGGKLTLTSKNADVDFTVKGSHSGTALGITTNSSTDNTGGASTSLLDNLITAGGAEGQKVTIAANGATAQEVTFGKGAGQVSTVAELKTALNALSGVSADVSGTALHIGVASGSTATSITIGGDAKAVAQLGLTSGITSGTKHDGAANATRTSLEADYNDVLSQIDSLSKDSSYNGINLLSGDDLKVTFNEKGTSSLTIKGVSFDSKGLGLNSVSSGSFQDNTKIDSTMATLDTALTSLRTQSSKFGSNLSTVQTRQDFTKNLVTTLQSGADNLVLADTNEEGANMLALQTRQQLSTTALSLANQASQAVLRLF